MRQEGCDRNVGARTERTEPLLCTTHQLEFPMAPCLFNPHTPQDNVMATAGDLYVGPKMISSRQYAPRRVRSQRGCTDGTNRALLFTTPYWNCLAAPCLSNPHTTQNNVMATAGDLYVGDSQMSITMLAPCGSRSIRPM